ncbi:MAG: hypothetical protein ACFFDH_00230 [Promethearchaeota archaeon]
MAKSKVGKLTKTKMVTVEPRNNNSQSIVMPQVTPTEALKAWKSYQELKDKIATEDDIQEVRGEKFYKKSYWRKLATFFNLVVDVVDEKHEKLGDTYVWHFICKATAPNGRSAIGTGSCDIFEKAIKVNGKYVYKKSGELARPDTLHNIRSTAETRAFNRAVSNLVGGGEVSKEEMEGIVDYNNGQNNGNNKTQQSTKTRSITQKQIDLMEKLNQQKKIKLPAGFPKISAKVASAWISKALDYKVSKKKEIEDSEVVDPNDVPF